MRHPAVSPPMIRNAHAPKVQKLVGLIGTESLLTYRMFLRGLRYSFKWLGLLLGIGICLLIGLSLLPVVLYCTLMQKAPRDPSSELLENWYEFGFRGELGERAQHIAGDYDTRRGKDGEALSKAVSIANPSIDDEAAGFVDRVA